MTKPTSCGILIINENDEVLVGLSTGNNKYDIPKGQKEDGESTIEAAVRECKEETGLLFHKEHLTFVGYFNYSNYKDLVLYRTSVNSNDVCIQDLYCESTFTKKDGTILPELSGYKWMSLNQYETHLFKNMQKVFGSILESLHNRNNFGETSDETKKYT